MVVQRQRWQHPTSNDNNPFPIWHLQRFGLQTVEDTKGIPWICRNREEWIDLFFTGDLLTKKAQ